MVPSGKGDAEFQFSVFVSVSLALQTNYYGGVLRRYFVFSSVISEAENQNRLLWARKSSILLISQFLDHRCCCVCSRSRNTSSGTTAAAAAAAAAQQTTPCSIRPNYCEYRTRPVYAHYRITKYSIMSTGSNRSIYPEMLRV